MLDLGTLGGTQSQGESINESGQVTGWSRTATGALRAFLYSNGNMLDLGTLGGTGSQGFGINDSGQVVGYSSATVGLRAFLYSGGVMTDLNSLLPNGSGWELQRAWDINNLGQITGLGFYNGQPRAFLMTPEAAVAATPEPASFALWGLGALGMAVAAKRRQRAIRAVESR
jgi:probable HAF family extracellular repeat protein